MTKDFINEKSRTYYFPNKETIVVDEVRILDVSKSGGHRLTTEKGTLLYIPYKWLAIAISSDKGWEA